MRLIHLPDHKLEIAGSMNEILEFGGLASRLRPSGGEYLDDFDSIMLHWDTDRFYLDAEVYSNNLMEWFFSDRKTGATDGSDSELLQELPPAFLKRLCEIVSEGTT